MNQAMDTSTANHVRWTGKELVVCFIATALLFWAYSCFTQVPIIHGDESGYLLNAAALAGYRTDAYSSYYPGYSLPVSLAFMGGADPDTVYDRIQVINALLWASAACLVALLLNRLRPQTGMLHKALVLAVTMLYPAHLVYGSLSLSENLFIPCTLLLGYVLVLQAQGHRWGYLPVAGLIVALLTLCHPKGALVGVAAAMALLAAAKGRPLKAIAQSLVMVVVAAAAYLLLKGYLDQYLREMLNAKDLTRFDHYPGMAEIIADARKILTLEGFGRLVSVMSGQALYVVVGTLGLVVLGATWCVRTLLDKSAGPDLRALGVFALFSTLGVFAFSVFFMKEGVRADHVMYGRYTESAFTLLLMLGAACLPTRRVLSWAAISALLLGVLVLLIEGNPIEGGIVVMNITSVDGVRRLLPGVLNVTGIAIIGALAILGVRAMPKAAPALAFVLLVFLANGLLFGGNYLLPGSLFRAKQHDLVDMVKRDFPEARCINYDMDRMSAWERNNYQFYFLPIRMDSVSGKQMFDCGGLLISDADDLKSVAPDAVAVSQEFGSTQKLWIKKSLFPRWIAKQPPLPVPAEGLAIGTLDKRSKPGLAMGWYGVESWGAWSKPQAYMVVGKSPGANASLRLEYDLLATATLPRTLRFGCNGKVLVSRRYMTSAKQAVEISTDALRSVGCDPVKPFVLQVDVDPSASPADIGGAASDTRALGIGLKRVAWRQAR